MDPKHPYLTERGLSKEIVRQFGLGFCSRGLMRDRIAIPIHDDSGQLVAYAGRTPGEPPEGQERSMLPPGFMKSKAVFNLHQASELARETGLVLVEGFFDVFRSLTPDFPPLGLGVYP